MLRREKDAPFTQWCEKLKPGELNGTEHGLSWGMVKWLIETEPLRFAKLLKYIDDQSNPTCTDSIQGAFGVSPSVLYQRWREYALGELRQEALGRAKSWVKTRSASSLDCWRQLLPAPDPSGLRNSTPRSRLRVLYLGNEGTERSEAFGEFLSEHFHGSEVIARELFEPEDAEGFDVVLLDWSQSDIDLNELAHTESPLGPRLAWKTPTVLLDSAGLLMATPWQLQGSWG